jgi:hypothetical protein
MPGVSSAIKAGLGKHEILYQERFFLARRLSGAGRHLPIGSISKLKSFKDKF